MSSSARYFGTDGIRDLANHGALEPERVLKLGRCLAMLVRGVRHARVALASDSRVSEGMLRGALIAGMTSAGLDVLDFGVLPTPALSLLVPELGCDLGVMISASHNPMPDNGIKVFARTGEKLAEESELQIERCLDATGDDLPRPTGAELGRVAMRPDAIDRYVALLVESFESRGVSLARLDVLLDCANGAASLSAPRAFARLGARVTAINHEPDGHNINESCGSMHPEALQNAVKRGRHQFGAAFDGDADRCLLVDERGELVDGDRILTILTLDHVNRRELPGATVVATVMSNLGLELKLKEHGVTLVRTPVGDKHVFQAMKNNGWVLGGEQSGHVILPIKGRLLGDGTYTALEVASIVAGGQQLSKLAAAMPSLPQKLINVKVAQKPPLDAVPGLSDRIRRWENRLRGQGRIVLRYSGTEALARVMVEGSDATLVQESAQDLADFLKGALGP